MQLHRVDPSIGIPGRSALLPAQSQYDELAEAFDELTAESDGLKAQASRQQPTVAQHPLLPCAPCRNS